MTKMNFSVIGLASALLASAFYAATNTTLKLTQLPAIEQMLIRSAAQHIIMLPVLTVQMQKPKTNVPALIIGNPSVFTFMVAAGTLSALTCIFLYEAIQIIPLGDAVSISKIDVFLTGIIARLWLKEAYSILDGCFAVLAVTGVVLIAKPEFIFGGGEEFTLSKLSGILLSICSAVCVSLMVVIIRKISLKDKIPAQVNVYYSSMCGAVIAFIGTLASGRFTFPCQWDYLYITLFIVFGLLAQTFYNMSMQYEKANTVAVLMTTNIIFTLILQVSVRHTEPLKSDRYQNHNDTL